MKSIKHHSQLVNAIIVSNLPISPTDKLVLSTLVSHLNLAHNQSFPSQQRIAAMCGLCRQTVNKSIQKLHSLGYIAITKADRLKGIGLRNIYSLKSCLIKALSVVIPKLGTLFKSNKPTASGLGRPTGTNQTLSAIDKANLEFEEHYQQIANTKRADISVLQALRASLKGGKANV